ncbi:MAG: NADH:flavin oxidoreductase/NADH oxidase family protein [Acidobacteriota bacterium]
MALVHDTLELSPLERPLVLPCGAMLENRLAKSAMTEGLAAVDGHANPRHAALYRQWSDGGAGLLITGNVMVDWRYLERPGNVVVSDAVLGVESGGEKGKGMNALERWAAAGTAGGNHLWVQINHPGRQCSRMSNAQPVAPSPVQLRLAGFFGRPRALTEGEILDIIERFARAAVLVQRAGFTGVQIHAAHGYLASQFLSPRVNRRTDRWGGSLEHRARFLLDTVRVVRERVGPRFPVAVKLNSADFQQGGFALEDAARVAGWLAGEGIDLLEISGGTYEHLRFFTADDEADEAEDRDGQPDNEAPRDARPGTPRQAAGTRAREAYFLDYAQTIRGEIDDVPLMVTGGFRSHRAMTDAVAQGELDVVGIARPLCVEPDLPRRLLEASAEEAPRWERSLRLAPGPLGPSSRLRSVRGFNHQASVAWFYRQILRLADGREPDTTLSARRALARHFRDEFVHALARRRAGGPPTAAT